MHLHTVAGPHWQRRLRRTNLVNILICRQACWCHRTLRGRLERFLCDENTVDISSAEATLIRPSVKGWHTAEQLRGVKCAILWYFCLRQNFKSTKIQKKRGKFLVKSEGRVYYGWCQAIWVWVDSAATEGWWIKSPRMYKRPWGFQNE